MSEQFWATARCKKFVAFSTNFSLLIAMQCALFIEFFYSLLIIAHVLCAVHFFRNFFLKWENTRALFCCLMIAFCDGEVCAVIVYTYIFAYNLPFFVGASHRNCVVSAKKGAWWKCKIMDAENILRFVAAWFFAWWWALINGHDL